MPWWCGLMNWLVGYNVVPSSNLKSPVQHMNNVCKRACQSKSLNVSQDISVTLKMKIGHSSKMLASTHHYTWYKNPELLSFVCWFLDIHLCTQTNTKGDWVANIHACTKFLFYLNQVKATINVNRLSWVKTTDGNLKSQLGKFGSMCFI
jgi:hypothetical protein